MKRLPTAEFERLVHEHHAAVYRSACRTAPDADAAADVTQEVFVRVLVGKVQLPAQPRAVLCWLGARLGHNATRAARRRQHHEEVAMERHEQVAENPLGAVERQDLRTLAQAAVAALPRELRTPLQLHCVDGLALAAVGSALRLPASTVHDRVQQGLERVRRVLSSKDAERAAALPLAGLGTMLAEAEAVAVPAGLEARLLNLPLQPVAAVAAPVVSWPLALALAVGAVAAVVMVAVAWPDAPMPPASASVDDGAGPRLAAANERPVEPTGERLALVAGAGLAEAGNAREGGVAEGSITGRVVDAVAYPVADAEVVVFAAGGLKPFHMAQTTTDPSGAFVFTGVRDGLGARAVRLAVRQDGIELLRSDERPWPPTTSEPVLLTLPAAAGLSTDRFTLSVAVTDEAGQFVPGVVVTLHDRREGEPAMAGPVLARAVSGTDGVAAVRGRTLGEQWLVVDGRQVGRSIVQQPVHLAHGGLHQRSVVVPAGAALQVDVAALDGAELPFCNVLLRDHELGSWFQPEGRGPASAVGSARFVGLSAGARYELHADAGWDYSPVVRTGIAAGSEPVVVRLKRRDDARAVGDHDAELHGRVVDAVTGEVLELRGFSVDSVSLEAGDSTSPWDRLEPPRMAQQMESGTTWTEFHEVGLAAGTWGLCVHIDGYAPTVVPHTLAAREVRSSLEVRLRRGATVSGRVVAADGQPVAAAHVFLIGVGELADRRLAAWQQQRERHDVPSRLPASARSQADGSFRLTHVPPGVVFRLVAIGEHGRVAVLPVGSLSDLEDHADLVVPLGP